MDNPYSAPRPVRLDSSAPPTDDGAMTRRLLEILARTKGWVRLFAVLGILGGCVMLLVGISFFAVGNSLVASKPSGFQNAAPAVLGGVFIVIGILIFYPAIKLNGFASAIGRLIMSGQQKDLEDAVEQQRAYWKYVGVLYAIFMILSIVAMIAGFAFARSFQKGF